jgi:hypothetical protein
VNETLYCKLCDATFRRAVRTDQNCSAGKTIPKLSVLFAIDL